MQRFSECCARWRNTVLLICLTVIVLAVAGCGGGGATATPNVVKSVVPNITVNWPARTRDLSGPGSALSVKLVLHPSTGTAGDVQFIGNRSADLSAHAETYAPSSALLTGTYQLKADFYAQADAAGSAVGTATVNVAVTNDGSVANPDGTPLGTVNPTGKIARVVVTSGQSVVIGGTKELAAAAYDANNNVITVTPGSFKFAVTAGTSLLTLAADGTATGVISGSATVTATADSITSTGATVLVLADMVTLALNASDIAYDSTRSTVYACTMSNSATSPSKVVPIDLNTNTLGTAFRGGASPTFLCLSGDHSHLFVGNSDGTINRVNLDTKQIDQTFSLATGQRPIQMVTLPGTTDSVIVLHDDEYGSGASCTIFDGGVARASSPFVGQYITTNESGTRIYGIERYFFNGTHYYAADIASDGIVNVSRLLTAAQGYGARIQYLNGKIVCDRGAVIDPDSGTAEGTLSFTTVDHVMAPVPGTNKVYFMSWDPKQIQTYSTSTYETSAERQLLGEVDGGIDQAVYVGSNRVVARTFGRNSNYILIVNNTP